ncbi:MAG: diversity-generating retroelement protein Avd [bacterium]
MLNEFDIPIFKKSYDLYKTFYGYRTTVPKQDRYTIWQKCDITILDMIEGILSASQVPKAQKVTMLEKVSVNVNLLRVLIRLAKDTRAIDTRKYVALQEMIDEIGRMLGGWLRSSRL